MAEQSAKGQRSWGTQQVLRTQPGRSSGRKGTDAGLPEVHEPPDCATSSARLLVAVEDELRNSDDAVRTFIWSGVTMTMKRTTDSRHLQKSAQG